MQPQAAKEWVQGQTCGVSRGGRAGVGGPAAHLKARLRRLPSGASTSFCHSRCNRPWNCGCGSVRNTGCGGGTVAWNWRSGGGTAASQCASPPPAGSGAPAPARQRPPAAASDRQRAQRQQCPCNRLLVGPPCPAASPIATRGVPAGGPAPLCSALSASQPAPCVARSRYPPAEAAPPTASSAGTLGAPAREPALSLSGCPMAGRPQQSAWGHKGLVHARTASPAQAPAPARPPAISRAP